MFNICATSENACPSARLARSRTAWWRAHAALRQVRIEIIIQARQAGADLVNAQESARLQRLSHEAARENRRPVRSEYAAGKASLVGLNEAQNDCVQSDAELARARTPAIASRVGIQSI